MQKSLSKGLFIAACLFGLAACKQAEATDAAASTSTAVFTGIPAGYTPVKIMDAPECDAFKGSMAGLLKKTTKQISEGKLSEVFPAIEAYKAYILKKSESGGKAQLAYGDAMLYKKLYTLHRENKELRDWYDSLGETQQRNLSLFLGWNQIYTADHSTTRDFEDEDYLYNVIGPNVFYDNIMKKVADRNALTDEQVEAYRKKVCDYYRGKGLIDRGYSDYFIEQHVLAGKDDNESIKLLKDELDGLLRRKIDMKDINQIKWVNWIRFYMKIKSELKDGG